MVFLGSLEEIKMHLPDKNGWGVFKLRTSDGQGVIFKGTLENPKEGETLRVTGDWVSDDYGRAIKATQVVREMPQDRTGIIKFLTVLPNIGDKKATEIVERLGTDAVKQILADPKVLEQFSGLTQSRRDAIVKALTEYGKDLAVEQELSTLNYGPAMRKRIKTFFGDKLEEKLKNDPYALMEVPGVGFKSLDQRIMARGHVLANAPERLAAYMNYCLETAAQEGHTWQSRQQLQEAASKNGMIVSDEHLLLAEQKKWLVRGELGGKEQFMLPDLAISEELIARGVASLSKKKVVPPKTIVGIETATEMQAQAVKAALENPISVITGGPGCGKTYSLGLVLKNIPEDKVVLCAPTGKAAVRMREATGMNATTIHSLLIKAENGFKLPRDCTLVIDEMSMVGAKLFSQIMDKLVMGPNQNNAVSRMLLIGDDDQLPSLEAGRVLHDLITSGKVPCTQLKEIMRQAEKSGIIRQAKSIREGNYEPILNLFGPTPATAATGEKPLTDFPITKSGPEAVNTLIRALTVRIPSLKKPNGEPYNPIKDVLVLAPVYRGELGCRNLNRRLQGVLNPPKGQAEYTIRPGTENEVNLRVGDKLILTKNDTNLGVVNGNIAYLKAIDPKRRQLDVDLDDGNAVTLGEEYFDHVQHGYAITVHKSQGSESPMVVSIFDRSVPPMMRQRSLLYTAVTRAKDLHWLIADRQTVQDCISNHQTGLRQTRLNELTVQAMSQERKAAGPER